MLMNTQLIALRQLCVLCVPDTQELDMQFNWV